MDHTLILIQEDEWDDYILQLMTSGSLFPNWRHLLGLQAVTEVKQNKSWVVKLKTITQFYGCFAQTVRVLRIMVMAEPSLNIATANFMPCHAFHFPLLQANGKTIGRLLWIKHTTAETLKKRIY